MYGFGKKISDHIQQFFSIYINPTSEQSTMFKQRIQFRGNQHLNKLLYDNGLGLRSIYERYKADETNTFTLQSAYNIFLVGHSIYAMTP